MSISTSSISPLILLVDEQIPDSIKNFLKQLDYIQIFTQSTECIQYIQNHSCQSIFLIISSLFAKKIIPDVYHYYNIIQIFLYCPIISLYTDFVTNYGNKLIIFDHEDKFFERFWNDLALFFQEEARQCLQLADEYKQRAKVFKQSCA